MRQCSETNTNIFKSLLSMSFICSIASIGALNGRKKNFHGCCIDAGFCWRFQFRVNRKFRVLVFKNCLITIVCMCVCLKVPVCCSGTMSLDAHWEAGLGRTELTGFLTEKTRNRAHNDCFYVHTGVFVLPSNTSGIQPWTMNVCIHVFPQMWSCDSIL